MSQQKQIILIGLLTLVYPIPLFEIYDIGNIEKYTVKLYLENLIIPLLIIILFFSITGKNVNK